MVSPVLLVALVHLFATFNSSLCQDPGQEAGLRDIYLMGLLPMGGTVWPTGKNLMVAMEMALDMVNNRTDILAGYRLNVVVADSAVGKLWMTFSGFYQITFSLAITSNKYFLSMPLLEGARGIMCSGSLPISVHTFHECYVSLEQIFNIWTNLSEMTKNIKIERLDF